jgi:hypothetical protein
MKFEKKGAVTVYKACDEAFTQMPEVFSALDICRRVRILTGRPSVMDGTILRRLRELRADRLECNYRCVDPELSIYKKVNYDAVS